MTTTVDDTRVTHPLVAAVADLSAFVDDLVAHRGWSMGLADCHEALAGLSRVISKLNAVEDTVVVRAESLAPRETAGHWARATRKTRAECRSRVRLATRLERAHPVLREAMGTGGVSPEQAKVILEAVEALSEHPEHQPVCEAHLVGLAGHHDAQELRVLGRRALEVVDPDAGDAHEAKLLAEQEKKATAAARFTISNDGHGQAHGRFSVPELHGDLLRAALDGLAGPGHVRAGGEEWVIDKPTPERLGQAFCDYIEGHHQTTLPDSVQVVVTCTIEDLEEAFDPPGDHAHPSSRDTAQRPSHKRGATSDSGQRFTPGELRRLACTHGILPAIMNSASEVLDLGRRVRLATRKQRTALTLTQQHCQHHDCDIPARLCHVHHTIPWLPEGPTDLNNLQLLCPRHHRAIHTHTTCTTLNYPMRT